MTSDSAAIPRPTPSAERIDAIDVLRGIALFGVMAINVVMEFRISIFDQFLAPGCWLHLSIAPSRRS